jgi:preprotein translocase SecE subunit
VARQTRAERRARREARERSAGALDRRPEPALAGDGGGRGAPPPPPTRTGGERHWGPPGANFVRESIGELRKVEWPGQNQVVQGTVVVIIACIIIGSYLYLADQVFSKFVSKVLLGQ